MNKQPVRLMHHDPRWHQEFLQTRSSILMACEGWVTDVAHIGSTAIAGLVAEPIIDVIAEVPDSEALEDARMRIEGLNFRRVTVVPWATGVVALTKFAAGEATHRAYLMEKENRAAVGMKAIKDQIETDLGLRKRLEDAKVHHWRTYEGDRVRYDQAKSMFFTHLTDQIGVGER